MSAAPHRSTSQLGDDDRVEALREAKSSMWMELDLLTVMQASINAAVELTGLETGAIYLLQENVLYLGATTPPLPPGFPDDLRKANALDHPHLMNAVDTGRPITLEDMQQEQLTEQERIISDVRGIRSILYVPLFAQDRPIGVFMVASTTEPRHIPSQDVSVSQALAESIARAIEDAHLFDSIVQHADDVPSDVRRRLSSLVSRTPSLDDRDERLRIEQLQHRLQRRLTLLQIRDQLLRDEIDNAQAVHSRSLTALEDELNSFQRLLADTRDELEAFTGSQDEHDLAASGLEQALRHLLSSACAENAQATITIERELQDTDLDTTLLTYRATRSLLEALCVPESTTAASLSAQVDEGGRILLRLELRGPRELPALPMQGRSPADLNTVAERVGRAGGELRLNRSKDMIVATASLPFLLRA